mgnify:FL=1
MKRLFRIIMKRVLISAKELSKDIYEIIFSENGIKFKVDIEKKDTTLEEMVHYELNVME